VHYPHQAYIPQIERVGSVEVPVPEVLGTLTDYRRIVWNTENAYVLPPLPLSACREISGCLIRVVDRKACPTMEKLWIVPDNQRRLFALSLIRHPIFKGGRIRRQQPIEDAH
jgi:hypothetical protein